MQVTTAANGVLLAAALINLLRSPKREWYFFAAIAGGNFVLDFVFTMAGHFGIYSTPSELQRRNFAGFKVLSGIAGLAILLSLELKEEDQDWGAMASSLLVSLSLSLNGAISMMPDRRPVPVVIGYTAAQSCFALSYPILFQNFSMEKSLR
jgi:uncharacterized membrane protein (UPF0136 family)